MLCNCTICFAENILTCTTHMFKRRMLTMHICPAHLCVWGDNCVYVFVCSSVIEINHDAQLHTMQPMNSACKDVPKSSSWGLSRLHNDSFINCNLKDIHFMFPLVCLCQINEACPVFCHRFLCVTSTLVHTPPTWTTRVCCSAACCFTSVTPSSSPDSSRNSASSKVTHLCLTFRRSGL